MCVSSFTDTDPLCYPALFAHHIAAPVKLAVAAFAPRLLQDVVASPAAQTLAVVHAGAGLVADPALRARWVRPQVPLAEIGRLFKVDQFVDARPPPMCVVVIVVVVLMMVMVVVVVMVMVVVVVVVVVVGVVELSGVSVVSLDKRGDVEALFEDWAHHPELWGDLPAGLQLAAPRRPVALAFPSHVVEHHLQKTQMEADKKERVGWSEEVSRGEEVRGGGERKWEGLMTFLITGYIWSLIYTDSGCMSYFILASVFFLFVLLSKPLFHYIVNDT